MIKFIFFIIIFFFLLVFLLGFSFLRGLKNLFFGPPSRQQQGTGSNRQAQTPYKRQKEEKEEAKIARKMMEDAEDVDYEEIKD